MKKTNNTKLIHLLYRWFDGTLSQTEQQKLDEGLKESESLTKEKMQIQFIRKQIAQSKVKTFQPGFAQKVLAQIELLGEDNRTLDLQRFYDALLWSFRRVALAGVAASVLLFIYNLALPQNVLTLWDILSLSQISYQEMLSIPLF